MLDRPTVVRGRIVVVAWDGAYVEVIELMRNPGEFNEKWPVVYGEGKVLGISQPVLQYAAGGSREIKFQLSFDGDRCRDRKEDPSTLDVRQDVRAIQSLKLPQAYGAQIPQSYPFTILFTYGTLYQSLPCVITEADPTYSYFTPTGAPVRATLSMTLKVKTEEGLTRASLYEAR